MSGARVMVGQGRILASHMLGRGSVLVTRFLTRYGDVVWMVDDLTRWEADPAGVAQEVYQGDIAGAKRAMRRTLARARAYWSTESST